MSWAALYTLATPVIQKNVNLIELIKFKELDSSWIYDYIIIQWLTQYKGSWSNRVRASQVTSVVSDSETLWSIARQAALSMGILQTRILEWVAMPSSRESSRPRNETHITYVSCIGRRVFTTSAKQTQFPNFKSPMLLLSWPIKLWVSLSGPQFSFSPKWGLK